MKFRLAERLALTLGIVIAIAGVVMSLLIPHSVNIEFEQFIEQQQGFELDETTINSALEEIRNRFERGGLKALQATPLDASAGQRVLLLFDDGELAVDSGETPVALQYHADTGELIVRLAGPAENEALFIGLPELRLNGPARKATAWLVPIEALQLPTESFQELVKDKTRAVIAPMVVIVLLLVYWIVRRATEPIRQLNRAFSGIGAGPLPKALPIGSRDELGQLTGSFNDAIARLARLQQARQRMASDIAHELRTPLHNLGGQLEAMIEGVFEPSTAELKLLLGQLELLTTLVEDLQQLSLAEAEEISMDCSRFEIATLLEELKGSWGPRVATEGGQLKLECDPGVFAYADPLRLRQVLGILIDNAILHGGAGVTIRLSARTEHGQTTIAVIDDGPGIPVDDRDKIFERLYRVDESRDRRTGGAGLGLAIATQLIRLQQGELHLICEDNQTCFKVMLPGTGEAQVNRWAE